MTASSCRRSRRRVALAIALLSNLGIAASATASDAEVVVSRGTASLTLAEIDARLEEVPADKRAGTMDSPERIDTLLQQLLLVEQLADEALAAGFGSDPRLAGQSDLNRKRMLAQYRVEQLREAAAQGFDAEALARERYLADKSQFALPELRTVRHILVSTRNRSPADARATADRLLERIRAGEAFEAVAREASEDPTTRPQGGLLADVRAGALEPRFDTAIFALANPGDLAPEPVETEAGWHLVQLVEVKAPRQQTFEDVRQQLIDQIVATQVNRRIKEHTDRLHNMPIEANPALVASLRTRYSQPVAPAAPPAEAPPPR